VLEPLFCGVGLSAPLYLVEALPGSDLRPRLSTRARGARPPARAGSTPGGRRACWILAGDSLPHAGCLAPEAQRTRARTGPIEARLRGTVGAPGAVAAGAVVEMSGGALQQRAYALAGGTFRDRRAGRTYATMSAWLLRGITL